MTTLTVWLLVVIGGQGYDSYSATGTVARFADAQECERVRSVIQDTGKGWAVNMRCIQAKVLP